MRILKRGIRGDDVREWQEFLQRLARDRTIGLNIPVFQPNGIFGQDTQRATVAFQQRFGLRGDGAVGRDTVEKAYSLGFKEAAKPAVPSGGAAVKAPQPLPPAAQPVVLGPPPPPPNAGTTRSESWRRLRSESWTSAAYVQSGLSGGQSTLQLLSKPPTDRLAASWSALRQAAHRWQGRCRYSEACCGCASSPRSSAHRSGTSSTMRRMGQPASSLSMTSMR